MRPVGIEEERPGAAIGEAEVVARRPRATFQHAFEPRVRGFQLPARFCHSVGVAIRLGAQRIEHHLLLRRGDVVVEEPVHHPYFQRRVGRLGNQADGAWMALLQVLDDAAGLHHHAPFIHQHRKALDRPDRRQFAPRVALGGFQQAQAERRGVLVERRQHLLAIGRKRVRVKLQHGVSGKARRDASSSPTNADAWNRHGRRPRLAAGCACASRRRRRRVSS